VRHDVAAALRARHAARGRHLLAPPRRCAVDVPTAARSHAQRRQAQPARAQRRQRVQDELRQLGARRHAALQAEP
jgi:hypothetical protein